MNDGLNVSLWINFSSRFYNSFNSIIFSYNWSSCYRVKIYNSIILWNKFNLLFCVYNFFFINRLIIYSSRRRLILFINYFFIPFNRSNNIWLINNLTITLIYVNGLFYYFLIRLNISFSDSSCSRYCNRNTSADSLIIYSCWLCDLFGVNWSFNFGSSNNRCLYNLLFNDRLRNNSSSNYRLWNNFSFD